MIAGEAKITQFKISFPNGQTTTNALYSNGRHQCQVDILVEKSVYSADGRWIPEPLTSAEVATLKVVDFNSDTSLPSGWSGTHDRNNLFKLGLWQRGSNEEDEKNPEAVTSPDVNAPKLYSLFLSVLPSAGNQTKRLKGAITVGGDVYTTYMQKDDISFDTFVEVTPTIPFKIFSRELTIFQDNALTDGGVDIDVYYYTPPGGVNFIRNDGFDRVVDVPNEGLSFETSYVQARPPSKTYKGGTVGKRYPLPRSLTVYDIQRGHSIGSVAAYDLRNTAMRAIRYSGLINMSSTDAKSAWRILDDFGCEQVYYMGWVDGGNVISISD
jgi:hypothetical protein